MCFGVHQSALHGNAHTPGIFTSNFIVVVSSKLWLVLNVLAMYPCLFSTSFLELTDSLSDSVLWAGGTPISELYGYVLLKSDSLVPIIGCNLPR